MRLLTRPLLLSLLLFVFIVLPLGMVEGWYGRVDYSGDAIPYLDMAEAAHAGDWKLALNPLWGLGYALLIAFAKTFFAATPSGEWNAIHLLNLTIYSACFASFLFLLRSIGQTPGRTTTRGDGALVIAGTALFLSAELCIDTVSRVGPDTLVTTLALLALSLVFRLIMQPAERSNWRTALALGMVLGCGYVVKTIFLPLSLVIVLVAAYGLYRKHARMASLVLTVAVAAFFAVPYAAGLSWAFGRLTLGESGTLNYAWHVNRLLLMHWQGGPPQFGTPLHPTKLLLADPPIFGFSGPFKVSYPPFFNPPYYYDGYRHFFSAKLQLRAIAANVLHLYQALRPIPMTYAVVLCLLLIALAGGRARLNDWWRDMLKLWPIWVPALAGVGLYLQVHLEGRYLPAFLLTLAAIPLAVFLLRPERWPSYIAPAVLTLLVAGGCATVLIVDRATIAAARHHVRYSDTSQWVLARYLQQHGLQPGDQVAVIAGPSNHCTWAHVDHLEIVSELEVDLYAPEDAGPNLFWDASPQAQQTMLDVFAQSGAKVLIARATGPKDHLFPGWQTVPGTNNLVHDLPSAK